MSTQEMTGTNKLVERILSDANKDAQAQADQAQQSISAIKAENDRALTKQAEEFAQRREAAVQSVLDGCKTRAALDGRKAMLKKKRAVMDGVFKSAYQALLALSPEVRGGICKNMLLREAEGGETVIPCAADRAEIEKAIGALAQCKVTLSKENADIEGGFLLVSDSYEKDCSFDSLFDELRDQEETDVATLLFSSEGGQS